LYSFVTLVYITAIINRCLVCNDVFAKIPRGKIGNVDGDVAEQHCPLCYDNFVVVHAFRPPQVASQPEAKVQSHAQSLIGAQQVAVPQQQQAVSDAQVPPCLHA